MGLIVTVFPKGITMCMIQPHSTHQVDSTLRSKRLCDLNPDLITTGQRLRKIAEYPKRVECLRTLNNNWQLIEWIKHISPQGQSVVDRVKGVYMLY